MAHDHRGKQQHRQTQIPRPGPLNQPERRTLWTIYKGIEPRYRILLGMGFMGFSMVGLWVSDKLEEAYPPTADNRITRVSHDDTVYVQN
ncbi:hypothetical protein LPJ64_002178 [Coemansia asiatica]|uniref:Uncharacterized protein n=1 Tax=Coemansia asiatica TaxID=1052880 RepID=A0A9W8CLB1_9FUNG|nr:hypothetical protein LPJ64_002178 [Coemansia asiatica]